MKREDPVQIKLSICLYFVGIFALNITTNTSSHFYRAISTTPIFATAASLLFNLILIFLLILILMRSILLIKTDEISGYGFLFMALLLFLYYFADLINIILLGTLW